MNDDTRRVELFSDDFSSYPLGERLDAEYFRRLRGERGPSPQLVGAVWEEQLGPWRQTTLHYMWRSERIPSYRDCALPWRLVERDGRRWIENPESFFNAVLTAGDTSWEDYVLELDVAVGDGPAGPIVRYHTSRQNYWVCLEAGRPVRLIRRHQDGRVVLAAAPNCVVQSGRVYHLRVTCDGPRIEVAVDDATVLSVTDNAWARGAIALRTEGPCRFASVRVWTAPDEAARLQARADRRAARLRGKARSVPPAKLLHEIALPPATAAVHLRDVNDDGRLEVLACELAVPQLDYIRVARITALDWEGKELWSFGEPMAGEYAVHGAFALNAADIDGDGRTEILTTRDFEILLLDGATGEVKRRTPTPRAFKGQEDHYERTVGDAILVCNLRGLPTARDFILKDRYRNLWAYTSDLVPLWHRHLNTGHYPRARDVNGDGRDEVMGGHSLLGPDGATLWNVPGGDPLHNRYPGPEHTDAVLIERFGPAEDSPLRIALAASDLGFVLLDVEGEILAQHRVGHAQALAAARFRPDLPGRQFVVQTAWGNFHILNLFDCEGNLLLTRELPDGGVYPVNWCGDGGALLRFDRHLADGNFEPVVNLPPGESVHPSAYDVNGDGVDEILLRRGDTLQVYGPESLPAARPVSSPNPPLTNWDPYGGFYL
ncbi:MAG TPA: hypothetical protein VM389_08460 [Phycisphaerae bacterium]|nr:hypothetical protein [Phycisphaerae bacterium]